MTKQPALLALLTKQFKEDVKSSKHTFSLAKIFLRTKGQIAIKLAGYNQIQFARKMGISQSHLSELLSGKKTWTIELMEKFEKGLK